MWNFKKLYARLFEPRPLDERAVRAIVIDALAAMGRNRFRVNAVDAVLRKCARRLPFKHNMQSLRYIADAIDRTRR